MTQHSSLSAERWSAFNKDQQILSIAAEMNRAGQLFAPEDRQRLLSSYERVLRLVDLTVQVQPARGFRRELLRWRDLIAALYVSPEPSPQEHAAAFRCLLQFTPEASRQIPYLLG